MIQLYSWTFIQCHPSKTITSLQPPSPILPESIIFLLCCFEKEPSCCHRFVNDIRVCVNLTNNLIQYLALSSLFRWCTLVSGSIPLQQCILSIPQKLHTTSKPLKDSCQFETRTKDVFQYHIILIMSERIFLVYTCFHFFSDVI